MSFCSKCGVELPEDGAFCPECGTPIKMVSNDVQANSKNGDDVKTSYEISDSLYSPKNRTCALILAIVFGPLGVHNFYLGKTERALSQLLPFIFGSILSGVSSVVMMKNLGLGIFLYIISLAGLIIPSITAIIDIVNIAKGTANDGNGLLVKNWKSDSSSKVTTTKAANSSSVNETVPLAGQKKTALADKLFFLFPIAIGIAAMYTPASSDMEIEYMYRYLFSISYICWNMIILFGIMAVGAFGFGFGVKKGAFMGLGASVGFSPIFKMLSWISQSCRLFLLESIRDFRSYGRSFSYFWDDIFDSVKMILGEKDVWTNYFKAVVVFFAVAILMTVIAKLVRKHNESIKNNN